ncbi:MAG TPA: ATP-binding protein [Candidatus Polarisedimenticolia bacterium]|nr:ATP-binding protein [Candidatus Polarisedimenticolia bacterium]
MSAVMAILREAARKLTEADGVTVVLREGGHCHYVEENAISPLWKGRRFPMSACISGWCMLHRKQVAIPDIYADPRIPHEAYRPTFVKSLAMIPIRSEDPIGAIGAYWSEGHLATPGEMAILQSLGDSAAMAISNVQLIASLDESNRRKDRFLSMLAHELRNPLAPLQTAIHLLKLRGNEPERVAEMQEVMGRQVKHLTHMVEDLLEVSRITHGKITLRRERVDLARLVRQSVEDHRALLEASGVSLEAEVPQVPLWVVGDPTRLAQVMSNLLDNAGKFTPAGGRVTVKLAAGDEAVLTVCDTGIGIEPDVLPRIFESFTQADHSLDRPRRGLGLGLSVTKGLITLHEGSIEAESAGAGRGASFTVRLPREPELPALLERSHATRAASKRLRVLVVEDNRDAAETLRLLLVACGYEVFVAYTGPDGVEAAGSTSPDIVLCDIGLPGMDGFGVAAALRQSPTTAHARLIAVTGYGQEEDRRRALEAGFDVHLVKPVDPEKLLSHLNAAS